MPISESHEGITLVAEDNSANRECGAAYFLNQPVNANDSQPMRHTKADR